MRTVIITLFLIIQANFLVAKTWICIDHFAIELTPNEKAIVAFAPDAADNMRRLARFNYIMGHLELDDTSTYGKLATDSKSEVVCIVTSKPDIKQIKDGAIQTFPNAIFVATLPKEVVTIKEGTFGETRQIREITDVFIEYPAASLVYFENGQYYNDFHVLLPK